MKQDSGPVPVSAAGGVIYRKKEDSAEILMIYRRDAWDLPKGKCDPNESIEYCARREVAEETGSDLPEIDFPLDKTIYVYQDEWGFFIKTTYWYAMTTKSRRFTPQAEEQIEKICWVELDRAIALAGFENLIRVLNVLKRKLSKR